jgi:beta-ribofuranosylaminobenzene 5'-phosphate synthase
MHSRAHRKNGGIGFSVTDPAVTIDLKAGNILSIRDERRHPFSTVELDELHRLVEETVASRTSPADVTITITGSMRTHVGMGSGTAIRLAIIEAINLYIDEVMPRERLIALSRRGGTSGIGTTTYFSGGLTLDLGRLNDTSPIVPSSQSVRGFSPTTLPPIEMPDWPLCLCVPNAIQSKTREEEAEFFSRTLPLSAAASYHACYDAVFGLYASVQDRDYYGFCQAVGSMQNTDWKKAEWLEYGEPLNVLKDKLIQLGADCVGMSSLGPMLFCFGNQTALQLIHDEQQTLDCVVYRTRPNNMGRRVIRRVKCES